MAQTLSRTKTVEEPTPTSTLPSSSTGQPSLSPSFSEVLEGLSDSEDVDPATRWARAAVPDCYVEGVKSITFQKIDIRESNDENGCSEIHLFGVTKSGHSILARVCGFEHYCYYPASPETSEEDLDPLREYLNMRSILGTPVISCVKLQKQKAAKDGEEASFLKISLVDHRKMKRLEDIPRILKSGQCEYRDQFASPEYTYEATVPCFLRFMLDNEIKAMTWLQLPHDKYKYVREGRRISCCQIEVQIHEQDLWICEVDGDRPKFAPLRILCFDIETNVPTTRANQFSDAKNDSVLQIGNMVSLYGETPKPFVRNVFTLGTCESIQGCQVLPFDDEKKLLLAWQRFFLEVDPDIVMGYNITQFDIPYLLNRARILGLTKFPFFGRVQGKPQRLGVQQTTFVTCPGYDGRLLLDIFHHIREHYRDLRGEGAYKLNGVSSHFLGQKKEDINYKQIPILQCGDANTRRQLALYCLKDVYLPMLLLDKLDAFKVEVTNSQNAHVPFNIMRVRRPLQDIAKRCNDAISHGYVVADRTK